MTYHKGRCGNCGIEGFIRFESISIYAESGDHKKCYIATTCDVCETRWGELISRKQIKHFVLHGASIRDEDFSPEVIGRKVATVMLSSYEQETTFQKLIVGLPEPYEFAFKPRDELPKNRRSKVKIENGIFIFPQDVQKRALIERILDKLTIYWFEILGRIYTRREAVKEPKVTTSSGV